MPGAFAPAVFSGIVGAGALVAPAAGGVGGFGAVGCGGLLAAGTGGAVGVEVPAFGAEADAGASACLVAIGGTDEAAGAGAWPGTVGATGRADGTMGFVTGGASLTGASSEFADGAPGGLAGGASAALRVTRTVSFFKGMLLVCLESVFFSFSLICGECVSCLKKAS